MLACIVLLFHVVDIGHEEVYHMTNRGQSGLDPDHSRSSPLPCRCPLFLSPLPVFNL